MISTCSVAVREKANSTVSLFSWKYHELFTCDQFSSQPSSEYQQIDLTLLTQFVPNIEK